MTARAKPCPICGKPERDKYKPFCSRRCADVDLAHWLGGRYRIPGREPAQSPDGSRRGGDGENGEGDSKDGGE